MKKIFVAVCTIALAVGLVGCGSNESAQSSSSATQVEGKTDDESVAKARELMESFFQLAGEPNVTRVDAVKTSTQIDDQTFSNVRTTVTERDVNGGDLRLKIQVTSDPEDEADYTQYINGHNVVFEQGEVKEAMELTEETYQSLMNPQPDQNARVYYDCAESISYYENDGMQVVQVQVDPAKLMESSLMTSGQFANFSTVDSCVVEYSFGADGKIATFLNTISGILKNEDGTETSATIDIKTLYTDYGTTEVEDLPEVTSSDAAVATEGSQE